MSEVIPVFKLFSYILYIINLKTTHHPLGKKIEEIYIMTNININIRPTIY